ncbi:MAG: SRPBCC family protein [Sphingobium sp.]|nr:SRPBCC family protein [Sphingobium sp.]
MGDTHVPTREDDAPITTSKRDDGTADASAYLVEDKGDALVGKTVTINRPRQELYAYWRDVSNLPTFMENVVSVEPIDERRSRWVVKAPAGRTVEWISAITEDVPGEVIAWASEEGADVPNSGRIDFRDAPGGRGTWVTATILYDPPGGAVGKLIAKMFQREPAIQARRELRRFKQLMETGEIATAARTRRELEEEQG